MMLPSSLLAQSTTTVVKSVTAAEPQMSGVGTIVFGVVFLVIVGGALILYLRHRQPRPPVAPEDA